MYAVQENYVVPNILDPIVVSTITNASLFEAGLVALIEPAINGLWYYCLDKLWSYYKD